MPPTNAQTSRLTLRKPRCYAVRRVNPFEGVLQVIETDRARSYSSDGHVWQVQVLADRPDHTWRSLGETAPTQQFFNFGLWDPEDGLQKVLANPVMNIGAMMAAANELIAELPGLLASLPFSLVDRYECWSMDQQGAPLALLATSEDPATLRDRRIEPWRATRRKDDRFRPETLENAEQLECQVHTQSERTCWFLRADDGSSHQLNEDAERVAEVKHTFPTLGLKTDWATRQQSTLVQDYLDWIAPQLLLLQTLPDDVRQSLEQAACQRASALSAVYRLIPRIIDKEAIKAARVEARLRHAVE